VTELKRTLVEDVMYPPHEPRKASTEYLHTHQHLVITMNEPCWICGITHTDVLEIPKAQQKWWQLETHHDELEWAAANGVDLTSITKDFPIILADPVKLREWLDSEGNMLVLCATHHRGSRTGIHTITYPAWKLQRWQGKDWTFITQRPVV
jgi:hypothetical protein